MSFSRRKGTGIAKYGNKRTVGEGGRSFDSGAERCLHTQLWLREKAGDIRDLECQKVIYLTKSRISWRADFFYFDVKLGEYVLAENKGFETERWRVIKQLLPEYTPYRVEIFNCTVSKVRLVSVIPRPDL